MAAFTFGWIEADGTPREGSGGKGMRPALAVLSARAVGAPPEAAVAGAVAVELVHAFSLVHDDIMDGDELRRHRETAWKAYGVGPAVLAGDALLALAMGTLAQASGGDAVAALARLSDTLVELVNGQADDVAFENRPWSGPEAVTVEEYQEMAAGKTGSLLGCAAAVGALLGGGPAALADEMARMGRLLGIAFQAVDDLLGIWGDPATTGKPVFNDLRQHKKTLPVVAALRSDTEPGRQLADLLETGRPLDEDLLRLAAELVDRAGGRDFAQEQAETHLEEALKIIESAALDTAAAGELAALSRYIVRRSH
ncbi:polyprenyl synthetase family protein [Actinomadura craniellae]|uniref:Polyprenyl synthetase family protein n=2 Tax=Actinomadura craniellae TaxID=2231787 RepID=A0A365HAA4_9ACTN|nr:polyprenyl synthetase family protein [Actinomadura craniellae]